MREQFLPVAERGALLARLRALLRAGGAIIVVDKCLASSGYAAIINARLTWLGKVNAGVSGEDTVTKEFMLAGVQRPIAVKELGKDAVEVFRFGDFAGWILENGRPLLNRSPRRTRSPELHVKKSRTLGRATLARNAIRFCALQILHSLFP